MQFLKCDFAEFPEFLLKILSKCRKYPKNYQVKMFIQADQQGRVEIGTQNELRDFLVLVVPFNGVSEELLKKNITFKYSLLKAKTELFENRLIDILQITKKSNPNLVLLLHEGAKGF